MKKFKSFYIPNIIRNYSTTKRIVATQQIHQSKFTKQLEYYMEDGKLQHIKVPVVEEKNIVTLKNESLSKLINKILIHFVPKGYPDSVTHNYLSYCKWSAMMYVFGSMCGVLSTQSLLYAVGVGSASIPLAAALNWVIKDGLGQLGGVVFASQVSTNFDADPKRWRVYGELALGLSILLEVLTPLFPKFFLPLASIANIGKNISCLASSATRAAINQSFTKKNNLGDVTGKAASQTIAASLCGTALGILISPLIGSQFIMVFSAFLFLYCMQIYCVFRSVECVELKVLNLQRVELLLHNYLKNGQCLTPKKVSQLEVYVSKFKSSFAIPLTINEKLERITNDITELFILNEKFKDRQYLINISFKKQQWYVHLLIKKNAKTVDVITAMFHACKIRTKLEKLKTVNVHNLIESCTPNEQQVQTLFEKMKEAGWSLKNDYIEIHPNRVEFKE